MQVYRFPALFAPQWSVSIYLDRAEKWRVAEIERALFVPPPSKYYTREYF